MQVEFKNTSQRVHDDFLDILSRSGEHMSKTVVKLSGIKSEKGPYQVFVVEKGS